MRYAHYETNPFVHEPLEDCRLMTKQHHLIQAPFAVELSTCDFAVSEKHL